jgi:hypothetical protein
MRGLVALTTLLLCTACILASTNDANAQCSARDVLQRQLMVKTTSVIPRPLGPVTSVSDVAGWKTITIGTFPDTFALLTALSAIGCGVGDSAAAACSPGLYRQRHENGGRAPDCVGGRPGLQG